VHLDLFQLLAERGRVETPSHGVLDRNWSRCGRLTQRRKTAF